jgi:uncharacterized protein involved in exopolysaccharide biosynthesis
LRNLERELAQQLSIYSEDAPQIVTLRRRIDTLREQVTATTPEDGPEKFRPGGAGPAAWPDRRPDRKPRKRDRRSPAELARLEDAIARTPLNAITLQSLERDYENIRVQYDSAVARLAQASTGERIELTSRGQRITLIEAANVPSEPARPNRRLIAAAALRRASGLPSTCSSFWRS